MSPPYRLDVRLAVIVSAVSSLLLLATGTFLVLEFTGDQIALEERGLTSQVNEWAALVHRGVDGSVAFDRPAETEQDLDPPYTGLLTGRRPIYGYSIVDRDGSILSRSEANAPAGRPSLRTSTPILSSGPALDGSRLLLIGELYIPDADVWLRVARSRSDIEALANTFIGQLLEEMGWVAVSMLAVSVVTLVVIVRMSLSGLRRIAAQAERISFENLRHERLESGAAPQEIQPLIGAVNKALDSIDAGASAQRDFSIHVAHELRTPLTDLRLRLEGLPAGVERIAALSNVDTITRLLEPTSER